PAFMPVGTQGTVKALTPWDICSTGAQCVLANAYHLSERPGVDVVASLGGIHAFSGWHGPMLTDSRGIPDFSLDPLRTIDDDGVTFHSHLDGRSARFTPESVMQIQELIGADIVMQLDECSPFPCSYQSAERAVRRSRDWADRCRRACGRPDQALFGIVQGS